MQKFLSPRIQGQLRHVMTALGPLLAAYGVMDEAVWYLWVGLTMTAFGFISSWIAPEKTTDEK